jgi:hypothetical protein
MIVGAVLLVCAGRPARASAQGILSAIRADARGDDPSDPKTSRRNRSDGEESESRASDSAGSWFVDLGFQIVLTPYSYPKAVVESEYQADAYFPRFPYDDTPGHIMFGPTLVAEAHCEPDEPWGEPGHARYVWPSRPRRWAGRVRMEYANDFDDVQRVNTHLLLTTASRFGLDTQVDFLSERLPDGSHDALALGDLNVVYRFAQGENAQFRSGIGLNWLDDPAETNVGFNFTYGADFFPHNPWILSATMDWGTLGSAELFRFRTTAGVQYHGIELYTGYEYLDIDTTQLNNILAGVRVWF